MSTADALAELARRRAAATAVRPRRSEGFTARERIARLLDEDSFLELGRLAHSDVPGFEERTPADGKIAGYGRIDGRTVAVAAEDVTVLAGAGGRVGTRKAHDLAMQAVEKGHPFVFLGEAGGARIPDILGSDGMSSMTAGTGLGRRMRRVPFVTGIFGECFGSPSWYAAVSDFVVQVKGSCMAVSGPRVLEIATGERVTNEELGGWEVHARVTGLTDRSAAGEDDALRLVREFLAFLPAHAGELPPLRRSGEDPAERQARLAAVLPDSPRKTYDVRDLLRTLVDDELLFELKPEFDRSVVTALARLDGRPLGIVANNPKFNAGAMGPDGCDKLTSFVCLCDSFNLPLLFVHDTPGFYVGKAAEHKRMPGKIMTALQALAMATVPKISLVVRKSYGMAYGNMGGPGMGMDFVFAWPTADISFMAPEVAANVTRRPVEELQRGGAPWRAAGLGYLDDVIAPAESRATLVRAFEIARGTKHGGLSQRLLAGWPTSF